MSLQGNLEDLGLGDILHIVSLSRKSGILSLQRPGSEGRIVFLHGDIVLALSSEYPEALGDALAQSGVATAQMVDAAAEIQGAMSEPARLAEVLVRHFGVPARALEDALRARVRKVALSFFNWSQGRYSFEVRDGLDPSSLRAVPFQGLLGRGLSAPDLFREDDPPDMTGAASAFDLRSEVGQREAGFVQQSAPSYTSTGLPLLKSMLQELHDPALGGGIVLLVLRFASEFMNRAVVFLLKEEEIVGIGQFGIDIPQATRGKGLRIPVTEGSPLLSVFEQRMPQKLRLDDTPWCRSFREALGGAEPAEVFVGPIFSEGKPVALLYGDNLPEERPIGDTESLEIFLSQAGMAMEKALLERKLKEGALG